MPPYTGPNRVPKSTYDNLRKDYDYLVNKFKEYEIAYKFLIKQRNRIKFIIGSNIALLIIGIITLLFIIL